MNTLSTILLSNLRNKELSRSMFREYANQLAHCLAQQAADFIATQKTTITTPFGTASGLSFQKQIVLVPILRSGEALLGPFMTYFPGAAVGFVGLRRDEKTAIAKLYYSNIPKLTGKEQIIMLDPMIATGGSATATLNILLTMGMQQEQILFVAVIAAQEGLDAVQKAFPKIKIIVAGIDKELNATKFIVPGLGDFGDRYFGTE